MWHYARNRMIVAARANGIDAIDGPFGGIKDPEGYRVQAAQSATLGAVGKWAIHPSQIEIANEVYAPTQQEIDNARAVVKAVQDAEAAGQGAASLNGVMIDAATARIFEAVLEQARLCGLE
jgi:citrate lyase subunit beta / citryl-CoA lyase